MRVCLVYDCLFPHTVGGAERWYRDLAERLSADGHEVTYLTLRQWKRGEHAEIDPRVRVVTAGPRMALYTTGGRRRMLPPLVFGLGVLLHLLRHGRRYDVVHTCAFPYFSLLAAALVRPLTGFELVVDWFEVWSRAYWRDYLGGVGGLVGALVQRLCALVPQRAFCFSELHAKRLREEGLTWSGDGPAGAVRGPRRAVHAGRAGRARRGSRACGAVRRTSDPGEAGDAGGGGDGARRRADRGAAGRVPRRRARACGARRGDRGARPGGDRDGARASPRPRPSMRRCVARCACC